MNSNILSSSNDLETSSLQSGAPEVGGWGGGWWAMPPSIFCRYRKENRSSSAPPRFPDLPPPLHPYQQSSMLPKENSGKSRWVWFKIRPRAKIEDARTPTYIYCHLSNWNVLNLSLYVRYLCKINKGENWPSSLVRSLTWLLCIPYYKITTDWSCIYFFHYLGTYLLISNYCVLKNLIIDSLVMQHTSRSFSLKAYFFQCCTALHCTAKLSLVSSKRTSTFQALPFKHSTTYCSLLRIPDCKN